MAAGGQGMDRARKLVSCSLTISCGSPSPASLLLCIPSCLLLPVVTTVHAFAFPINYYLHISCTLPQPFVPSFLPRSLTYSSPSHLFPSVSHMPFRIYPNNLIHTMQPASMMNGRYSSPTLFYTVPEKHQFEYRPTQHAIQSPLSQWNISGDTDFSIISKPKRPTLMSNPSRKRSRDHLDEEELVTASTEPSHADQMEVVDEPIYGPGMTLLNPSTSAPISAESQSGTWLEEKAEEERIAQERRAEAQRPILRPSKSSRLDLSEIQGESSNALSAVATTIDPAAATLGVGWKVMSSDDEDMQKACRGWAKFIENHYPLTNVQIVSKSEGKEAFLVSSSEGFWLFKEDLDEGRLISITWQDCVAGLTSVPMVFKGWPIVAVKRVVPSAVQEPDVGAVTGAGGMDLD